MSLQHTIDPDAPQAPTLSPDHLAQLSASALAPEVIAERGYQSLDGTEGFATLRAHGFTTGQAGNTPGLLLPVWGTDGQRTPLAVYRPDTPRLASDGRERKYEFPRGRGMRLDVPPTAHRWLDNPTVPLVVTEGQKKGDALASLGREMGVIALLGVDCWRGKNPHGGSVALPDWDKVALNGRRVIICYDSDLTTKPPVRNAMRRLANFLRGKGAEVLTLYLPPTANGAKHGIDDWLASDQTWDAAMQHLASPWEGQPDPESLSAVASLEHLPKIRLEPGQLHTIGYHAHDALVRYQREFGLNLFQRAGSLVFVTREQQFAQAPTRPSTVPSLQTAPLHKLRGLLCSVASWWRYDGRQTTWVASDPPLHIAQALLDHKEWQVPVITGLATRPFLRPDFTLCQTPGYDTATGMWLEDGFTPLAVPARPTRAQAEAAWTSLQHLWVNFPFASERDKAATLAALLTVIARPAIPGPVPAFTVVSPTPGTGKGLLIDTIALVALGAVASRWLSTKDDEEMRKQLVTIGRAGEPLALFDNLETPFGGEALNGAITAQMVQGRTMATHEKVATPWRVVVAATGNNLAYRGDMPRRVVQIALESPDENPETRTNFAHADLLKHTADEQATYLLHACTILLAYQEAGRPKPSQGYGSFESWNALIGGCVEWLTGHAPRDGQEQQIAEPDDLVRWRQFLDAWRGCFQARGVTLAQMDAELRATEATIERQAKPHYNLQPDEERLEADTVTAWRTLRQVLGTFDPDNKGPKVLATTLGYACRAFKNRVFDGVRFTPSGKEHHAVIWKVAPAKTA